MCRQCLTVNSRRDPTRTTTLRRRLEREINRRWRNLRGQVRNYLDSVQWPMTPEAAQGFVQWMNRQAEEELLGGNSMESLERTSRPPDWMESRIHQAYEAGARHGFTQLTGAGVTLGLSASALLDRPEARGRFQEQMRQVADDMSAQIRDTVRSVRRSLASGSRQGRPRAEIRQLASDRIRREGQARMRSLGRTEVVSGHHNATMATFEYAQVEEVRVMAELETVGDNRVCRECARLEQAGAFPLKEAENMIPVHPNCRCAMVVVRVRQRDERAA